MLLACELLVVKRGIVEGVDIDERRGLIFFSFFCPRFFSSDFLLYFLLIDSVRSPRFSSPELRFQFMRYARTRINQEGLKVISLMLSSRICAIS